MKIHELKSAKALLKAALQALFESSSFEVMTGLIEKDYDIKKFKQMTLGDFTKDEVVPSKRSVPISLSPSIRRRLDQSE